MSHSKITNPDINFAYFNKRGCGTYGNGGQNGAQGCGGRNGSGSEESSRGNSSSRLIYQICRK